MQSLRTSHSIQLKGNLVSLDSPIIMGILNLTPDSFYSGSRASSKVAFAMAEQMFKDGASIIDLGGQSSRPGADLLSDEEELSRVLPIVEGLCSRFPDGAFSIDTFYSKVAKACVEAGAAMINDISAGSMDDGLLSTVANLKVPYVLMHMAGQPKNMQQNPSYSNVIQQVMLFLSEKLNSLRQLGINDVIIDPGFGFGKSLEHNYKLLSELDLFQALDCPVLAGVSRKSMIYKLLNVNPEEALNGTTALHMKALESGASILRVHDVKEAVESVELFKALHS